MSFSVQLASLDLADIDLPLTDDLLVEVPRLLAGSELPIGDGSFVKSEGGDNGRNWTAISQQGQYDQDQPRRMFASVEHSASRFSEGSMTSMTDVAPFFVGMDANMVTCATVGLGAYYQFRAHRW